MSNVRKKNVTVTALVRELFVLARFFPSFIDTYINIFL